MAEAAVAFIQTEFVVCVLSIGTGLPKVTSYKTPGTFSPKRIFASDLVKALKDLATETEGTASQMKERFINCGSLYNRLNVDRGLEDVLLEDWEKLSEVTTHTMEYLRKPEISKSVDEIVLAMVGASAPTYTLGQLGR